MDYSKLAEMASEYDGECKVCIVLGGAGNEYSLSDNEYSEDDDSDYKEVVVVSSGDEPPIGTIHWDYFFSDEAECFDFERFGITRPDEY